MILFAGVLQSVILVLVVYYLLVVFWCSALSHVVIGGILFAGGVLVFYTLSFGY